MFPVQPHDEGHSTLDAMRIAPLGVTSTGRTGPTRVGPSTQFGRRSATPAGRSASTGSQSKPAQSWPAFSANPGRSLS